MSNFKKKYGKPSLPKNFGGGGPIFRSEGGDFFSGELKGAGGYQHPVAMYDCGTLCLKFEHLVADQLLRCAI
jgi:hypothetical protein